MTGEDLRAVASRIVERMVRAHPAEAATLASLVLSEILAVGLFSGEQDEVIEFATAVNTKLAEISLRHGADRGWQLMPTEPPRRH
jgi:hypothetical protein